MFLHHHTLIFSLSKLWRTSILFTPGRSKKLSLPWRRWGRHYILLEASLAFFCDSFFFSFPPGPCFTKVKTEWEFYRHITVKCYHPAHSYFVKNFSNCNSNFCKDSVVNKSDKRKSWFVPLQNFLWVNVTEQWCCLTTGVSGGREPHIVKWEP